MAEKTNNSHPSKRDNAWWNNRFYTVLISVALIGGGCAFLIPLFITSYGPGDNVPGLRQAFLAITGGTLAILTLWETRRKNDQEHMRQVHAERRSRYATAIEQLADEKAPIRLGGVYTLVKLVDDWLADEKTLPNEEERREEGQVIINSLCAYIRSSFDLASKAEMLSQDKALEDYEGGTQQFAKDQARFREEKELRLTILSEIKKRLNGGTYIHKDGTRETLKGLWSDFNYDFSKAYFFYRADFKKCRFESSTNFHRTTFAKNSTFSNTIFTQNVNFKRVTFAEHIYFQGTIFKRNAIFSDTTFRGLIDFSGAVFNFYVTFFMAIFKKHKPTFSTQYKTSNHTINAMFSTESIIARTETFQINPESPYKIETEEQELNGVTLRIPKGSILFDPGDPSEQESNNDS